MQAYLLSTYIGRTTSICKAVYNNVALPSRCVGCGPKQAEQHSVLRFQTKDCAQAETAQQSVAKHSQQYGV